MKNLSTRSSASRATRLKAEFLNNSNVSRSVPSKLAIKLDVSAEISIVYGKPSTILLLIKDVNINLLF